MLKYKNKGVKIGINELTVRLNPAIANDKQNVTEADIEAHATKYADMFRAYCNFDKNFPGVLTNVSIWGLTDRPDLMGEKDKAEGERDYDYDVYGTHSGLFTEDLREKTAFNNVIEVLKSSNK